MDGVTTAYETKTPASGESAAAPVCVSMTERMNSIVLRQPLAESPWLPAGDPYRLAAAPCLESPQPPAGLNPGLSDGQARYWRSSGYLTRAEPRATVRPRPDHYYPPASKVVVVGAGCADVHIAGPPPEGFAGGDHFVADLPPETDLRELVQSGTLHVGGKGAGIAVVLGRLLAGRG